MPVYAYDVLIFRAFVSELSSVQTDSNLLPFCIITIEIISVPSSKKVNICIDMSYSLDLLKFSRIVDMFKSN